MEWYTIILSVVIIMGACIGAVNTYESKKRMQEDIDLLKKVIRDNRPIMSPIDRVTYSNDILDYARNFTMQITALRFRDFIDAHKVEKLTLAIFKNFASDTASEICTYIDKEKIDYENLLFSEDFLQSYVIWITFNTIKSLIDKSISGFEEE